MEFIMVKFNIENLLKKNGKSKYWLCKNMNITSRNLNRIIYGETTSISFKYLEDMCKFLDCELSDLISIEQDDISNKGA
ncbi:MAG: helix-turn-helix transcriptional regulator [Clostridia bacterium]|jgi:putative transcriptional regulator|nr:helix-turn-helix transcriptional regulator [Clostridia bacterium]